MFKKIMVFTLSTMTALIFTTAIVWADVKIDKSKAPQGIVSIQASDAGSKDIKVQIQKGTESYVYSLKTPQATQLPLQLGNGDYKIMVLENVGGGKYKAVGTDTVSVTAFDEKKVFTNSIQLINFNDNMTSVKEMNKLIASAASEEEKISIIYSYVVKNISYDHNKASSISSSDGYIPVIDEIYNKKSGICYDYSSLFAAILRDNGIPTKLQMGYAPNINTYHAWNEVYLNGQWVKVDTTYDAAADQANVSYSMVKDSSGFQVAQYY